MDPLAVGISKLSLLPGDLVVAKVPEWATREECELTRDLIRGHLPPNVDVMVTANVDLSVLRDGVGIDFGLEPAVMVEVPAGTQMAHL